MGFSRPLNERTLTHHAARVSVPTYHRASLRRGVVHISVGSFHRSHQAAYFDELARRGLGDGWALTGVGLHRRNMKQVLDAQDGLYTLVTRGPEGDDARVVGAITRYLFAPEENAAVLDALVDDSTRLVTLTVTAAGYYVDVETGLFLADHPSIVGDLADPSSPTTAIGLIVEALARRRRAGRAPFTVLSCDNMPSNGPIARTAVLGLAARRDAGLAGWIDANVTFPSSMVDRITPSTTRQHRRLVAGAFGVRDRWPVVAEPFSQWIIEDAFCNGRPPLDEVGVQFVDDVRPYSLMKTRLLNGTHAALGYLGTLAGHQRLDEVMRDPAFARYAHRLMTDEITPLLPPVHVDLAAYGETLRRRFANPAVADPLARLRRNGSTKVPAHLASSIREARALGRRHPLLTLAVSAWCRCLRNGTAGDDPQAERLQALARAGGDDPRPLLADEATFGSLGRSPRFVAAVERDLHDLADAAGDAAAVAAARARRSASVLA